MSITPFLSDQAFDPETVETMGEAFATTCEALGLSDRADAMTRLGREPAAMAATHKKRAWAGG